ncbi:hypothetical protein [Absidia glauca]|uniref:Rhodanese domain-containing protein n=1 Tax=Absidia glauca TaxID=4829 RepID=A0A163TG55_ABSGL|nr:hypothetical protein [Absidia glauca]
MTNPFNRRLNLDLAIDWTHPVRSLVFSADGKIKGAVNLPYPLSKDQPKLFNAVLADLDRTRPVVFQCRSGRRSQWAAQLALDQGFTDVSNMEGGLLRWVAESLPVQPFSKNHSPWVHAILEPETNTAQYIVTDLETREAYVIDSVLDYNPLEGVVKPTTARKLVDFIKNLDLNVTKVIETHVHADHLTAAWYIKDHLDSKPEIWIGKQVKQVQETFAKHYNTTDFSSSSPGFDRLVEGNDTWLLGKSVQCSVLATPGHTPACVSYLIGDAAFVGDTLFMPDLGTARCDFPSGSAPALYNSIHSMYSTWPDDTRIYVGHDYPPPERAKFDVMTTLEKQKLYNKMIHVGISMDQFVALRQARDRVLKAPRLIHPSLQERAHLSFRFHIMAFCALLMFISLLNDWAKTFSFPAVERPHVIMYHAISGPNLWPPLGEGPLPVINQSWLSRLGDRLSTYYTNLSQLFL